ncbi:MAG: tryptophan--tRNA ligase [Alphaproteobacteria bacterium]|nr:tryptophan--tRNA ligase [Alphaproteobacteria bacterium]
MARPRALTGIQPSGVPHIGNVKGMIEPAVALQATHDTFYFIASYHALTTTKDPVVFRQNQLEAALAFLAFGYDPEQGALFRQEDVPEVTELAWILGCFINLGILQRAHAFKAAQDSGREINLGTFAYPVLMAADILIYDSTHVPVGKDQKQHVEMARDFAQSLNSLYGADVLVLPEPLIKPDVATVPGIDGRKMSKSYGNTILPFVPPKKLRKRVMQVVTDSKTLEEPKDPETCTVFELFTLFADEAAQAELAARYRGGGMGYGHAKQALFEVMDAAFAEPRERYLELAERPDRVEEILAEGARKARAVARETMSRVREAVGLVTSS